MAPLRYAAKFDPFLSLDCAPIPYALHPGAIQRKEGIKFCHLATLPVGGQEDDTAGVAVGGETEDGVQVVELDGARDGLGFELDGDAVGAGLGEGEGRHDDDIAGVKVVGPRHARAPEVELGHGFLVADVCL